MDEIPDCADMILQLLGKCQGLAHQAANALPQGGVQAFTGQRGIGHPAFLSCSFYSYYHYRSRTTPNFTRLRWFLRRLSQVGVPSAVKFCFNRIEELTPAISEICHYLVSVGNNYGGDWKVLGENIFGILENGIIKSNKYFQIVLLSLFSRNPMLNNTHRLISMYQDAPPSLRREILLSAYPLGMGDWIRELKENFAGLDPWSKRAFIIAAKTLPLDERKFFLDQERDKNALNDLLVKWSKG